MLTRLAIVWVKILLNSDLPGFISNAFIRECHYQQQPKCRLDEIEWVWKTYEPF